MSKVPSQTEDCFESLTAAQQKKLYAYKDSIYKIMDKILNLGEENEYILDLYHSVGHALEYIPEPEE